MTPNNRRVVADQASFESGLDDKEDTFTSLIFAREGIARGSRGQWSLGPPVLVP